MKFGKSLAVVMLLAAIGLYAAGTKKSINELVESINNTKNKQEKSILLQDLQNKLVNMSVSKRKEAQKVIKEKLILIQIPAQS